MFLSVLYMRYVYNPYLLMVHGQRRCCSPELCITHHSDAYLCVCSAGVWTQESSADPERSEARVHACSQHGPGATARPTPRESAETSRTPRFCENHESRRSEHQYGSAPNSCAGQTTAEVSYKEFWTQQTGQA